VGWLVSLGRICTACELETPDFPCINCGSTIESHVGAGESLASTFKKERKPRQKPEDVKDEPKTKK